MCVYIYIFFAFYIAPHSLIIFISHHQSQDLTAQKKERKKIRYNCLLYISWSFLIVVVAFVLLLVVFFSLRNSWILESFLQFFILFSTEISLQRDLNFYFTFSPVSKAIINQQKIQQCGSCGTKKRWLIKCDLIEKGYTKGFTDPF